MTLSRFYHLNNTYLGFDTLFAGMEQLLDSIESSKVVMGGYPPYNLFKDDRGYSVELALAGFKKHDIKIEHDRQRGLLVISGSNQPKDNESSDQTPTTIKRGIANRSFHRTFTVADNLKVIDAELEDGLLHVRLEKIELEEDKPLLISVR